MSNILSHHPTLARFKKFFHLLLHEEKKDLWTLVIYGVWVSICSLIIPIAVQTFVNTIGFGLLLQPILILAVIVFAFSAFSGVLRALQVSITEVFQERLFVKTAMELANRIPRLKVDVFKESYGSEWMNRFFEVVTLQKTFSVLVLDGAALCLQVLFGMILLALYHPFLLVLNFIIIIFVSLFFFGLQSRALETSIEESKAKYSMAAWLQDIARNSESFRSRTSRKFALEKADSLATKYVYSRRKHFRVLYKQILSSIALQILTSAMLLGVGGWLVVKGQLTLGQLVASELILSSVVSSIGEFGQYLESYYDAAAALDKIGQLFELPLENSGAEWERNQELHPIENEVQIQASNSQPFILKVKNLVIHNGSVEGETPVFNFDIPLGHKVAIVGPSGTGKSALLQTLYGMTDFVSGVIEIDGVNLKYSSLDQIRSKISYISGGNLFDGTLLENIQLNHETNVQAIQSILAKLGLEDVVNALPQGLNTRIVAGKYPLSRVQAQKILIARALVAKPKLILVDDIMDGLDPTSDPFLKEFLSQKDMAFSMIFATQSPDKVRYCNQVISMNSTDSKKGIL